MSELTHVRRQSRFSARTYAGVAFAGAAIGFGAGATLNHFVDQIPIKADRAAIQNDRLCEKVIQQFGTVVHTSSLSTNALAACGYNKLQSGTGENSGPTSTILSAYVELPSTASLAKDIAENQTDIENYGATNGAELGMSALVAIVGVGTAVAAARAVEIYRETH